jgi:hypothetical protein
MIPEQEAAAEFGLLEAAWDDVLEHWHDDVARDFAAHHWEPLKQESELYLRALRSLLATLSAASREVPPG